MTTKGPPTTAQIRKAFRQAVDAIDLAPEVRVTLLGTFNDLLRSEVPNKRNRRQEQNQALRDLQGLVEIIPELVDDITHVIKRNDFTSGQRHHAEKELWGPIPGDDGNDMTGTPSPYTSDPTGEEACWDEMVDPIGRTISSMSEALGKWLVMAKWIRNLSSTDVSERAKRTIPDCKACGKPIEGARRSLYHLSCYDQWRYYSKTHPSADKTSWELELKNQRDKISQDNDLH